MGIPRPHYLTRLVLQGIISLMTTGVIYGWMSMELIFDREGLFYNLCDVSPSSAPYSVAESASYGTLLRNAFSMFDLTRAVESSGAQESCAARNLYLSSVYTTAASVGAFSFLPWGAVLDWAGPRITSCSSLALALLGNILLTVANDTTRRIYHLAFLCIAVGGIGVHLSGFHLANSAPLKLISVGMALFPGIFNASPLFYSLLNWINSLEVPLATIMIVFDVLLAALFGVQFWIQEWRAILKPVPPTPPSPASSPSPLLMQVSDSNDSDAGVTLDDNLTTVEEVKVKAMNPAKKRVFSILDLTDKTFLQQVKTWWCAWTLIWISSVQARNVFWQGNFGRQLRTLGTTSDTFAVIISWYPALILVLFPLAGMAFDKYGLVTVTACASVAQVLFGVLTLVPSAPVQLITGLIAILSRSLIMNCYFNVVSTVCGFKSFGRIVGLGFAAAGLINFSSILLNSLIDNQFHGDFFWVQVIELAWGIPLCAYPWYLWKAGKDQAIEKENSLRRDISFTSSEETPVTRLP